MAGSLDTSTLAAFQDYNRDYQDDLMNLGLVGFKSAPYFMKYEGIKGERVVTYDDISDIVQRFSLDFSADDDTWQQHPTIMKSVLQKAEMRVSPKQDLLHYKAYLTDTKADAESHPYAKYVMEKASKKIANQIEFDQAFTGVEDTGSDDAVDIFSGLLSLVAADQALGSPVLTPVATGVLSAANIIASLEAMDDAFKLERRDEDLLMYVSDSVFKMYRRAYRAATGFHPDYADVDTQNEIMLDGSTTKIVRCVGMGSSQRVILTPKRNVYAAYDLASHTEMWEFEKDHRFIDMWCDYWFGAGFLLLSPEIVVINDQA